MTFFKVEKLTPGMVLSEDVLDMSSRLLLPKGQEIEQRHIRMLKMWGIFEVHIEGEEGADDDAGTHMDSKTIAAISQEMIRRFKNLDLKHPAVKEILRLSIHHWAQHYSGKPAQTALARDVEKGASSIKGKILTKLDRLEIKLPEVPSLVFELNEIIADPLSSSGDIAQAVNKSPSLAAILLKIVNSAFYGFRSKIDNISRAVTLIGSKEVSNLALGITVMETFKDIPKQVMDVSSFLEHSLACGVVARLLAAHSNIADTEQMFVSGMLHDIGRLVLCKYFPQFAKAAIAHAFQSDMSLFKAERKIIGHNHVQIGKKLLEKWKLPYALENNIYYHHHPSASPTPDKAVIVHLADIMVHGLGVGSSGEHMVPSFDSNAWEKTKLSVGAFPSVIKQALHQIETFREVFSKG